MSEYRISYYCDNCDELHVIQGVPIHGLHLMTHRIANLGIARWMVENEQAAERVDARVAKGATENMLNKLFTSRNADPDREFAEIRKDLRLCLIDQRQYCHRVLDVVRRHPGWTPPLEETG